MCIVETERREGESDSSKSEAKGIQQTLGAAQSNVMASPVGVHERHGHFRARIGVDGTNYKLGDWPTEEEAARAYDMAIRQYRPGGP